MRIFIEAQFQTISDASAKLLVRCESLTLRADAFDVAVKQIALDKKNQH